MNSYQDKERQMEIGYKVGNKNKNKLKSGNVFEIIIVSALQIKVKNNKLTIFYVTYLHVKMFFFYAS